MSAPDDDPAGAWGVTLATAPGGSIATKARYGVGPGDEIAAPKFKRMDLKPLVLPSDIGRLGGLLLWLMDKPSICLLRGAVLPGVDVSKPQRRLLHDRPHDADGRPTIFEVPRQWLALDLDAVEFPAGVDWRTDPRRCAQEATKSVLPEWLLDADLIVQFTSGMGFKPTVRMRTWHLLDRPLVRGEVMRLLADRTMFDASVLVPVQPIYTARPVFRGGVADPLPGKARAHLLRSRRRLAVVPLIPPVPVRGSGRAPLLGAEMGGTVEEMLAAMRPMQAGGIGLYESSKKIVSRWVRENGAGLDAGGIIARCIEAAARHGAGPAYLAGLARTLPGFAQFCAARQEAERDRVFDQIAGCLSGGPGGPGKAPGVRAKIEGRNAVLNDVARLERCFGGLGTNHKESA